MRLRLRENGRNIVDQQLPISFHFYLGCVRLGNPDLDFQNLYPDFPIEREIRPHGGFQLRNPNPDFMDFLFTV